MERVYPRVYGESVCRGQPDGDVHGLSPRVRGIRLRDEVGQRLRRSIPACTGNPADRIADREGVGVYPRVYGESDRVVMRVIRDAGLSPRVRGIPGGRDHAGGLSGSIPACTGNPIEPI